MVYIQFIFYFVAILLFSPTLLHAQASITMNPSSVRFNINNENLYVNGSTQSYENYLIRTLSKSEVSRQFILNVNAVTGGLKNGINTIPLDNVSIQVTSIVLGTTKLHGTFPVFPLSAAPQNITPDFTIPALYSGELYISIKYTVTGGTNLLKPGGTYTTSLNFAASDGITTPSVSGTLSLDLTNVSSIVLNNTGTTSLNFEIASDYKNGVKLTQLSAMNLFSNQSYKVSVQALGNLKQGLTAIGIDNVNLAPVSNPSATGVSTVTVPLSLEAQNIIISTQPTLSQNFDLKYFTEPLNSAFVGLPAGNYTTNLTYTITSP
jgi:hypothetical protein